MNTTTKAVLVAGMAVLAVLTVSGSATAVAENGVQACVDFLGATCGAGNDSWGTVVAYAYCVTTNVNHPLFGC